MLVFVRRVCAVCKQHMCVAAGGGGEGREGVGGHARASLGEAYKNTRGSCFHCAIGGGHTVTHQ